MKKGLLLCFLCFLCGAQAQTFSWLSTGRNLNLEMIYSSLGSNRNLIVATEIRPTTYIQGNTELITVTKTTDSSEIKQAESMYPSDRLYVISYDPNGLIKWQFPFRSTLYGIQHNAQNEIILLANIEGELTEKEVKNYRNQDLENDDEAEEEELEEEEEEDENTIYYGDLSYLRPVDTLNPYVPSGLYALVLNQEGHLIHIVPLILGEDVDVDVLGFEVSDQGNYVFHGIFGDNFQFPAFKHLPAKAGGDCVFVFTPQGKMLWGDYLRYDRTSCCSYYSEAQSFAIAPNGSVYLAGAFNQGMLLSTGQKLKVNTPVTPENKEPLEAYLIAYSPTGEIRWVKQSESATLVHKIAASNDEVFLSYFWNKGVNTSFQIKADTSNNRNLVIAAFNTSGKLLWHTTHGAARIQQMVFTNKQLFVAGAKRYGSSSGVIGKYTLQRLENSYIAVYKQNGSFVKTQPLKTNFDDRAEPVYIFPVSDNEMYVAFSMFIGTTLPLRVYDKLFRDIKNSAYVGVIGKIQY